MLKIKQVIDTRGYVRYHFFCPGCQTYHGFNDTWTWNKDFENPTISPSLLTTGVLRCHSYIVNGMIRYLADSEHELVGQTVELPIID